MFHVWLQSLAFFVQPPIDIKFLDIGSIVLLITMDCPVIADNVGTSRDDVVVLLYGSARKFGKC